VPSPFDLDFAAADVLFEEAFGVPVEILREGESATPATAEVVMREQAVVPAHDDLEQSHQTRDYLIAVAGYRFGGGPVPPLAGDRIRETINGAVYEFELMRDENRPAAEWADPAGTRWLIRTKKVT
jgi:hypothetical protein